MSTDPSVEARLRACLVSTTSAYVDERRPDLMLEAADLLAANRARVEALEEALQRIVDLDESSGYNLTEDDAFRAVGIAASALFAVERLLTADGAKAEAYEEAAKVADLWGDAARGVADKEDDADRKALHTAQGAAAAAIAYEIRSLRALASKEALDA